MTNEENLKIALEHISYSRVQLWRGSVKSFERRYFQGEQFESIHTEMGKRRDKMTAAPFLYKEEMTLGEIIAFKKEIPNVVRYHPKFDCFIECDGEKYRVVGEADAITKDGYCEIKESYDTTIIKGARKQIRYYDFFRTLEGEKPFLKGLVMWREKERGTDDLTGRVEIMNYTWSDKDLKVVKGEIMRYIKDIKESYATI